MKLDHWFLKPPIWKEDDDDENGKWEDYMMMVKWDDGKLWDGGKFEIWLRISWEW